MTKAERIFRDTYTDARIHIKKWGYKEGESFNRLTYGDNETVCTRTINDIMKLIESEKKAILMCYKYSVITKDEAIAKGQALKMVKLTAQRQTV